MKITDWNHLMSVEEIGADQPPAAYREVNYLSRIIMAATSRPAGQEEISAVWCRKRPGRKRCCGRLAVRLQDVPPEIHWMCPQCGDAGIISNWRGSVSDYSRFGTLSGDDSGPASIVLGEDDYEALLEVVIVELQVERIVHGAHHVKGGVLIKGTLDELDELTSYVAGEANHATSRAKQRRLDRLFEICSDALEEG